jgi:nucleotide-binding universal stress UspA family protein
MKLLVALDMSRSTPAVFREARLWARRLSAELLLLHVAAPDPDFIGYGTRSENLHLVAEHKVRNARQQLEALAIDLRKDGLPANGLLIQGLPAESILLEADSFHADAILMGAHARGPLKDPFIGSVTRQVLHRAGRPVILVPPGDIPL